MKMKLKKCFAMVVAVGCMAAMLTACGSSQEEKTPASTSNTEAAASKETEATSQAEGTDIMSSIKEKGVLVLGTASGYPPYEFVSVKDNGAVIGIDIELGKAIADKMGVDFKVVDMPFGELIATLATGKCDIAIAGMPETEEKAKSVDFTEVYINDEQSIIVRKDDVDKYKTLEDFKGKKIGVEKGSSCESVAQAELKDATFVSLAKVPDIFLELKNSKIDAIVIARVVGTQYIINDDTLTFANDTVAFENKDKPCQGAVAKGNEEFLSFVNEVIKENQDNGNFDKWVEEYSKLANEQGSNS
ncbi:MAG TPA: amino acid ABC transporter substrate-binding protein [Lachnospiraceae bacterium]|nr:amino acid ABC transporter substrate-binding protein [Lachnospiraceae bacterium]